MNANNASQQPAQSLQPQNMPVYEEDEIDLFELWQNLVAEKWLILGVFLVTTALAIGYAFSVKPTYQATASLLPPLAEKVTPMNTLAYLFNANVNVNSNATIQTPLSVFDAFKGNLLSKQNLMAIYQAYHLENVFLKNGEKLTGRAKKLAEKRAFDDFVKGLRVQKNKNKQNVLTVQFALQNTPELTVNLLNALIKRADQETVKQIVNNINVKKTVEMKLLKDKVLTARHIAKQKRMDKIKVLNEAIEVAQQAHIIKPISSGPQIFKTNQSEMIYLLGTQLLTARKHVLATRESDDSFIPHLRNWQTQLQALNLLTPKAENFQSVQLDQLAVVAEKIKPKKSLIIAVAGVTGLILGIFLALFRRMLKNHKEEIQDKQS